MRRSPDTIQNVPDLSPFRRRSCCLVFNRIASLSPAHSRAHVHSLPVHHSFFAFSFLLTFTHLLLHSFCSKVAGSKRLIVRRQQPGTASALSNAPRSNVMSRIVPRACSLVGVSDTRSAVRCATANTSIVLRCGKRGRRTGILPEASLMTSNVGDPPNRARNPLPLSGCTVNKLGI